ncbi:CYTH and CHAD domain-containing protein [Mycobacterium sp. 21AC1]|uniref:CYTH and CHAD domain-containing protein n=1 Tax=[Mycobacterium] appelbergii TaxID=2939269 RepID=UPI0029392C66|nr:CYTH and CHAD domain-containing protein [Mycobacterium sp. 21AC1]MDV3128078.1 CYTH and CHAD domain-containing protein [Mycobacterium sp. 21AC1]
MATNTPKTSRYTEVERKFEVTESTVWPSFDGLSAVARVDQSPSQRLDAVYFDTPGRDLAAHRITLRRRTGGSDAGWHLKLPAGPDARTEVRAPLGSTDDAVPEALVDTVLAIVRDRTLSPIARITTRRTVELLHGHDGSALAEFCDDQVTASATEGEGAEQQWREWELELVSADAASDLLDRLSNRLFDAGARTAGHGSKLAKVLESAGTAAEAGPSPSDPVHRAIAEQVAQLLAWDRAVRADGDDAVHQMRVTTRKIRSLLQESADSFGLADDGWILDELRTLAGVLGVARDAEVLAERYERALDELAPELVRGPIRERLVDGAKRRYEAGLRRSLLAMRSQRYFRLLDALEALITAESTAQPGEDHPPVTIDAAYKRVRKAAKAADEAAQPENADHDEALHRIRKGAKRLRYTAAATGAAKVADRAKSLQTLLGDHQDSVVSRTHLRTQAETAYGAGEDTFTYGLLYQQEDDLAERSRAQLDEALKRLRKAVRKSH